jgi:hypothetical protein
LAASRAPSRHGSGQTTAFFFAAQLEQTICHSPPTTSFA